MEYSHKEFLDILRTKYSIDIQVVYDQETHLTLELNNHMITGEDLKAFGYEQRGQYNPLPRTNQEIFTDNDIQNAIKVAVTSLSKSLKASEGCVQYQDVRDFLYLISKDEKSKKVVVKAIERVLDILADNFQYIWRKKNGEI